MCILLGEGVKWIVADFLCFTLERVKKNRWAPLFAFTNFKPPFFFTFPQYHVFNTHNQHINVNSSNNQSKRKLRYPRHIIISANNITTILEQEAQFNYIVDATTTGHCAETDETEIWASWQTARLLPNPTIDHPREWTKGTRGVWNDAARSTRDCGTSIFSTDKHPCKITTDTTCISRHTRPHAHKLIITVFLYKKAAPICSTFWHRSAQSFH